MKILVPVKRVIDYNVKVRVKPDQSGVELANVKMAMNPFDEIAVEQALRIKEAGQADEIILVSVGLKAVVDKEQPGLVLCGKQAIDDDSNQTGQMLSALLGWAQATFASGVELAGDNAAIIREVDGGLEHISVKMPAVITVDLRLNEPRYASLPNIMKAKKKPIDQMSAADLGVDTTPRLTTVKVEEPAARQAGIKVGSVSELVDKLKNEAKVI